MLLQNATMNTTLNNSSFSVSTGICIDYSPEFLPARTGAYTLNIILGLPINCYILWLIVTEGTKASELFTFNLAVSEVLACLSCVFNVLFTITNISWMVLICTVFDFFLYFSRPLFQTLICVERYLAVLEPVFFLRCKPLRYRLALIIVVWLLVVLFSITYVLNTAAAFIYYIILVFYILIVLVMLYCCMSVLRALRQLGPGHRGRQTERDVRNNMKRKAFNLTLIYTSVPLSYSVFIVMTPFYSTFKYTECYIFLSMVALTNILTGFIHPLLYLKRLRKLPCIKDK